MPQAVLSILTPKGSLWEKKQTAQLTRGQLSENKSTVAPQKSEIGKEKKEQQSITGNLAADLLTFLTTNKSTMNFEPSQPALSMFLTEGTAAHVYSFNTFHSQAMS